MKFKTIFIFLLLFIILFSNTTHVHSQNIDDLAYVIALGIDKGKNNMINLSIQIAIPSSSKAGGSGGGSSQSSTSIITTIECYSIDSGINLANSYISKEINLSHCKVIVFSEEVAVDGISDHIYTLMNKVQIRPDCDIIVSRNLAEDFLSNSKPTLESITSKYYDIAPTSSQYTGYTDRMSLSTFFSRLNDTFSEPYAILGGVNTQSSQTSDQSSSNSEKDSNNKSGETNIKNSPAGIENMGLAVFKGDKLIGELNAIETVCHLLMTNRLQTCNISVPSPFDDSESITLKLKLKNKTKTNVKLVNGSPYVKTNVSVSARIVSISKNTDYRNNESVELLEKYANSYLETHISSYLYKTSRDFGSDIAGIGKYAVSNFITWDKWANYNWLNNYKNSFFSVKVDCDIKSSYLLIKT